LKDNMTMRLTRELVALCHREVQDAGPLPGIVSATDADFRATLQRLLETRGAGPIWLFAYGSLIWKPEVPHEELKRATAQGWHRAFSMKVFRYRATLDQHGFMMCLDPGGYCEGVVLRLPEEDIAGQIDKLLRREISRRAALEAVRWIEVEASGGPTRALAFYAGPPALDSYMAGRPLAEVAHGLARACGHWGSGADYLYNTVSHLEQLGIHDEGLWELQEVVAAEIEALHGLAATPS
jgi:glutathione-specific gamma-glutamylcyclotransferase